MAVQYFHVAVGFAGVIDVMRAVAAPAAVEAPAFVDCTDTKPAAAGTAISFGVGYSLACVLGYFSASRKMRL